MPHEEEAKAELADCCLGMLVETLVNVLARVLPIDRIILGPTVSILRKPRVGLLFDENPSRVTL